MYRNHQRMHYFTAGLICIILLLSGCSSWNNSGTNNSSGTPSSATSSNIPPEPVVNPALEPYRVGYGDTLKFQVLDHPEYSLEIKIPPDETILLPRIPAISTHGKTVEKIRTQIRDLLSVSLKNPDVTVNLSDFSPMKILVLGEVQSPGVFPYERGMRLIHALTAAGGMKDSANRDQIVIIPKDGRPAVSNFDLQKTSGKGAFLNPGDLVVVPPAKIHKIDVFIDQFFARTNPLLQYYLNILDIKNYNEVYHTRG
jgi:polysaccharide biosynthesis/export protein